MSKFRSFFVLIFILIIEFGCSTPMPRTNLPTPESLLMLTTSPPLATVIERTETPISTVVYPTLSLPVPTTYQANQNCSDVLTDATLRSKIALNDLAKEGTIGLIDSDHHLILENLETQQRFNAPSNNKDSTFYGLQVSPDLDKLLYIEDGTEQDTLWVITSENRIVSEIPMEKNWGAHRWINNDQLELSLWGEAPGSVIVVDLTSGSWQEKAPPVSDIFKNEITHSYWTLMYGPNLKWLIYLEKTPKVVVFDVINQMILWQKPGSLRLLINPPEWSPIGDQVAVLVDGILYRVDHSGLVTQTMIDGKDIKGMNWSANGLFIAFWVGNPKFDRSRLHILNTRNNEIKDYCIESDIFFLLPVWSPDSQYFVIYVEEKIGEDWRSGYFYVNRINGAITQILDEEMPLAWLK